jgi:acylphosphatase
MEQNMLTWEIIARGRVQGVGFRHFASLCARQYAITGYVRNQVDGSVRIVAQGEAGDLDDFCALLKTGRHFILVQELNITELDNAVEYNDFEIR